MRIYFDFYGDFKKVDLEKCMFCLQLQNDIELYFYTKRQLTKYCEEMKQKFYFDYSDNDTKVKYFKVVI